VAAALLLSLLAGCATSPPPPTMAEVLDGAGYAQPRAVAIQEVTGAADSLNSAALAAVPGAKAARYQSLLRCLEGQNSLKVHDGYLFHCDAVQTTYYGWRGRFGPTAAVLNAAFATQCSADHSRARVVEPAKGIMFPGTEYSCGSEVVISVQWGRPATLDFGPRGDIDQRCGDPQVRCGSGQTAEQIGQALRAEDWIAGLTVVRKYHTEWVT
jgi:hypothetical protein